MECRKQIQRQWLVRMSEELRQEPNAYFITLTIDDKSYSELSNTYNITDNNEIATSLYIPPRPLSFYPSFYTAPLFHQPTPSHYKQI